MTEQKSTSILEEMITNYVEKVLPLYPTHITSPEKELKTLEKFSELMSEKKAECFDRSCLPGHITGSAVVVNKSFTKTVLTHHKKLNKWLQLGGHSDGDNFPQRVSLREAVEESGIEEVSLVSPVTMQMVSIESALPIDFDIHDIPARKDEPAHFHFDVRFIIVAENESLTISEESNDLKWFGLDDVKSVTSEASTLRQVEKIKWLKENLNRKDDLG